MSDKQAKFMIDSDGNQVPLKHVNQYDRTRDKKVRAIVGRWIKARKVVESCVAECLKDLDDLQGERTKQPNGALGARGNFSVRSFDGLLSVAIKQSYNITLDARAGQARDMMFAYAESMIGRVKDVAGVDVQFLRDTIATTFKPSSTGQISVGKVFDLLGLGVRDPQWLKARALLQESMDSQKGKAYLIVAVKPDRQHDAEPIRLDAADCWPMVKEVSDAN